MKIKVNKNIEFLICAYLLKKSIYIRALMLPENVLGLRRRSIEHTTGKLAAEGAMQKVLNRPASLEYKNGNIPIWPKGFVGSITHKGSLVISAVSLRKSFDSIGIDLEFFQKSDQTLEDRILTTNEREILGNKIQFQEDHLMTALFSVKEAAYKCISYLGCPQCISFKDIELTNATIEGQNCIYNLSVTSKYNGILELEGKAIVLESYKAIFSILWKKPINSNG
ncbi:MAG: 4'-phosphopantetheinyl transferase superfamily protein [Bacteriovoracales bacterium]|nr:4'-phosphopantetheinyl transferase superfamily protein [Bacteriovoracales bacterium]